MNSSRSSHEINGLPHCLVDGFKHRMPDVEFKDRCYFLTHYHSDHYGGLASYWKHGKIYCSNTTANLICNILEVNPNMVQRVTVGVAIRIKGARVTFMEANHCPGAVILLFELDSGLNHLHTGDLRYCPAMKLYPALQNVKIDRVYLDTTYAHPKHTFMPQDESIAKIVNLAKEFIAQNPDDGIIFISAYNLGKERVIFALADAVKLSVYMDADKIKIISQIEGGLERVQSGRFTSDPQAARIHVCNMGFLGSLFPYFKPNFDNIRQHVAELNKYCGEAGAMRHFLHTEHSKMPMILPAVTDARYPQSVKTEDSSTQHTKHTTKPTKFGRVIAFIPTGWADMGNFNKLHSVMTEEEITVCTVPYSEHSNYTELIEFVTFLKPREVIPTVYSDEKNRLFILDLFRNCVDRISNMRNFIAKMSSPAPAVETSSSSSTGTTTCTTTLQSAQNNGSGFVASTFSTSSSSSSSSSVACDGARWAAAAGTAQRDLRGAGTDSLNIGSEPIDLCDSGSDSDSGGGCVVVSKATTRANGSNGNRTMSDCIVLDAAGDQERGSAYKKARVESVGVSTSSGDVGKTKGPGMKGWSCTVCTYRHTEVGNELFLQCALCSSPRCA